MLEVSLILHAHFGVRVVVEGINLRY